MAASPTQGAAPVDESSDYFKEKYIVIEYKHLQKFVPPGIYVMPSMDSLNCWTGLLFARSGPYKGAVLNFRVNLPSGYPAEAPSIELLERPFHPHVNPITGILDCVELTKNWQPHKNFVWQLLVHLKKVFYQIEVTAAEKCFNPEAARLFQRSQQEFLQHAQAAAHRTKSATPALPQATLTPQMESELADLIHRSKPGTLATALEAYARRRSGLSV